MNPTLTSQVVKPRLGGCQGIAEVVAQLDQVVAACVSEHNKLGYFAALYRDVTVKVKEGIASGRFEDGPRMERLDVTFANRYLDALDGYWNGKNLSGSWLGVFKAAHTWRPVILQHLLLGMNVHINLDLGIAAAQTAPGDSLPALKHDFDEITVLLDEMTQAVQARIDRVSPWIRLIDSFGGRTDTAVCNFAIGGARDLAWSAAVRLAPLAPDLFQAEVAAHDARVATLGEAIRAPGWPLNFGLLVIRVRETGKIASVIDALRLP